tara:strand:- start:180 stop:584 length:405 start_codon:yes stop_codon:yes gene_type:complete
MQNLLSFTVLLATVTLFSGNALANKNLISHQEPDAFDNIKVVKLASNNHASDFLIYIKKHVPAHYHESHTEIVYIIEGTATMRLDDQEIEVKKGDYIRILPGQIHAVQVTSIKPLKVLSIQTPEFDGSDRVMVK